MQVLDESLSSDNPKIRKTSFHDDVCMCVALCFYACPVVQARDISVIHLKIKKPNMYTKMLCLFYNILYPRSRIT